MRTHDEADGPTARADLPDDASQAAVNRRDDRLAALSFLDRAIARLDADPAERAAAALGRSETVREREERLR